MSNQKLYFQFEQQEEELTVILNPQKYFDEHGCLYDGFLYRSQDDMDFDETEEGYGPFPIPDYMIDIQEGIYSLGGRSEEKVREELVKLGHEEKHMFDENAFTV